MRKRRFQTGPLAAAAVAILVVSIASWAQPATTVETTRHFEFHSDPWINLHHFLYQWAREDLKLTRGRPPIPERADVAKLSSAELDTWNAAIAPYRESVGKKWYLDLDNLRLNQHLVSLGGNFEAEPPDTIPAIAGALGSAMPIYQKLWWPQHDKGNRAWIAALMPLVRRHEERFAQLTMRVYDAQWPEAPFRVDVSAYFNARAGYTSREGHIILYSTDPASQGLYSLEMLLHEVQHAETIGGQVASYDALAPLFEAAGTKQPGNLWHALIFATAGEFARSVATAEKLPEHTPYWIKQHFENVEGWSELIAPVDELWLPVIRGESARTEAIPALVQAFQ